MFTINKPRRTFMKSFLLSCDDGDIQQNLERNYTNMHSHNAPNLSFVICYVVIAVYSVFSFDFHCQMMEASLYDKIMDQQRLEPEFFRVGFYGKKFPFFLRVKKSPYLFCVMTIKSNRIILLPSPKKIETCRKN